MQGTIGLGSIQIATHYVLERRGHEKTYLLMGIERNKSELMGSFLESWQFHRLYISEYSCASTALRLYKKHEIN